MKKYYVLICSLFFIGITTVRAQYTVLHNFIDSGAAGNANGEYPTDNDLILSGSVLYGTTQNGGAYDYGTIFSINTDGTGYKDLWDFDDTGTNGAQPYGSLILSGGVLYGMTLVGGINGVGNIFSINTNGTGYKDIYNFNNTPGTNPFKPVGTLILSGGVFYGMTNSGGANENGAVFSVNMNGTGFTDLLDFGGLTATGQDPNGNSLILSGNVLYGMTPDGGPIYGDGTVFSMHTDGSGYKELLDFDGTNGANPDGYLTLCGNKLYGMTDYGGLYDSGCMFSIDTNGGGYSDMIDFRGAKGAFPEASFILSGNLLYGMASGGGDGYGTIFSIDTAGSRFKALYYFMDYDGANPWSDLTLSGNLLYGMTQNGGENDNGVIFKIDTGSIASVDNLTANPGTINVYPNPSNGIFNIRIGGKEQGISEIQIYNMLGEEVYNASLNHPPAGGQGNNTIDLSNQPNGVYLYRVLTESAGLVGEGKIIIQK